MRKEPWHGHSQSKANPTFDRVNKVLYLSLTYGIYSWPRQIHCSDFAIHNTCNLFCRLWAAPILSYYCNPTDLVFPIHWVSHYNWGFIFSQWLLPRTLKPCYIVPDLRCSLLLPFQLCSYHPAKTSKTGNSYILPSSAASLRRSLGPRYTRASVC